MNMCIHGTITTGVDTLRAIIWQNFAPSNNEFVWLGNITDMEGMGALMQNLCNV